MNYVFTIPAQIEYREAAEWYAARSLFAGSNFIQEVEAAIAAIRCDPARYQPVSGGFRVFRLKRFPFKIFFSHSDSLITIYGVVHNRRRPDSWRDR